jgi:hypothetical protein
MNPLPQTSSYNITLVGAEFVISIVRCQFALYYIGGSYSLMLYVVGIISALVTLNVIQ